MPLQGSTLHDLRSISKSVVGLLYGRALARGLVPDPAEPLVAQFPEYPDLAGRTELTVEHALTMTLGLKWDESVPYTSAANSEIAMEMAPDRCRYILELPSVEAPGRRWHYCGGASALVGALIAKGSGVPRTCGPASAWSWRSGQATTTGRDRRPTSSPR